MNEFSEVFPNELPVIPLEEEIDLCIDFLLNTNTIYIPRYRMTRGELIKFKAQLKDLLDKGFI